ncbi:MAG: hypothetical protein IJY09_04220 [Lachnospiraceae bacterium]|nr:hypothetical protein [Lachnospiraceae bacterium]
MLYFATALYEEAVPLIRSYGLKQDTSLLPFEIFKSEQALLIITKPGATRAAIALSHLFTLFPPTREDFFLSLGTAACPDTEVRTGSAFLIHRITDAATTRTSFPELLFTCPFSEAALITVPAVLTTSPQIAAASDSFSSAPVLYDMEGAAIYETAATYLHTHQFALLRVVSDHMTELKQITPAALREQINSDIGQLLPELTAWLAGLMPLLIAPKSADPREAALFADTSRRLCCSVSMQNSLKQLLTYLRWNLPEYLTAFAAYLDSIQPMPCTCRKEGKRVLEQLRNHFL